MNKLISLASLAAILLWNTGCKKTEVIEKTVYVTDEDSNATKPAPEYVITHYGAKGDGSTDCSAIINDLISKLPISGGTIVIPEGDFLLSSPIVVNKNFVTIKGLNPGLRSNVDVPVSSILHPGGGSKLILGAASAGIMVPTLPDVGGRKNRISGLVVHNLLITGGSTSKGTGISIQQDNDGIRIEDVIGINLNVGIVANAADAMIIKSCWISECRNSIEMSHGIQNLISNCQLGAQPGGITMKLNNQENFNVTGNHIYPDGDVNLQMNNCTYGNISGNNFQSYYVGMIELNQGSFNLITSNVCWMRTPSDANRQLRGKPNDYGVIRILGSGNMISNNTLTCNWANTANNPVTIRSAEGSSNSYHNLKISNTSSSRVFYVNETTEIFNSVPASKVFVDGNASNVYISY